MRVYLWAFYYPLEWNLWLKEKWQNYIDQVSDCIRYSTLEDYIQDNMLDVIRKGMIPKTWARLSQNQWGPFIIVARRALEEGAAKGRGGKGSIFVWASGNGGDVFGSFCSDSLSLNKVRKQDCLFCPIQNEVWWIFSQVEMGVGTIFFNPIFNDPHIGRQIPRQLQLRRLRHLHLHSLREQRQWKWFS